MRLFVGSAVALLITAIASSHVVTLRGADQAPVPTFSRDVAPILFSKCSVCHHAGGAAPFSVLDYETVRQHATLIADATKKRLMPPWKFEPGTGEYVGFDPLTPDQIEVIQRWVANGSPAGDVKALPPVPQWNEEWQLGKPDLVVTLPKAYTLPPEGTDVFRILVFPLPVDATRFVRGIEFHPGNPKVVHHATIRVDTTPTSRRLDAEDPNDPEPGYEGLLAHSAGYPDGHFLGWTPGQVPPLLPKGLAWRLERNTDLVVQLHLQPTGKPEAVLPSIGFFFGDDPPERTPAMIRLGRQNIDIPAGERAQLVTDSYKLPVDVEVQAVQPHAHYRARQVKGLATLPDGTTTTLIEINDWDFRWQHVFRFVKPMALPKGTTLEMRYTYDNSAGNPNNTLPLQRVLWGQRSADEMGDLWIQVLTANDQDRVTLNESFRPKMLAEDIVGAEMMTRAEPNRVALHDDAAMLYILTSQADKAVEHFAAVVALKPGSAVTHFNLATALILSVGQALEGSRPKLNEAIQQLQLALQLDPNYAAAHNNLGSVFLQLGDVAQAVVHLEQAARLEPRNTMARYGLGRAYRDQGNRAGAIEQFRVAIQQRPNFAPALSELAFLLATAPEDSLRNGAEAKQMAQLVVRLAGGNNAAALDVLAAAHAELGDFDAAVETATIALQRAPRNGAPVIAERLELYKQKKPYRIPATAP
jgi:tetratricopeptide (TPR) repeat protein